MAKGKLTPDKWGPLMPAQNSIAHAGPYYYRDTECVMVEFTTDKKAALELLPAELELLEPVMAFMVIETNHWTTVGPYSETYLGILCTYEGEVYGYVPGVYVTGELSQIAGREIWGFGKKRAHKIELIKHNDGKVEAIMEVKPGDESLQALMHPQKNEPAESLVALPLICLKIIPDVSGSEVPALAQLTTVTFAANALIGSDGKAEVFSGPGHMKLETPSDVQIPINEITNCVYAHFNADLPYGKVLKTYSKKEILAAKK
jgi:acetoacetate decarboxylase